MDLAQVAFPSYLQLYNYRTVVVFTGDNNDFATSGFALSDQDALTQWLDSGGRLWVTGQNDAEVSDSNTSFSSPSMGRSREYHGYLGLRYDNGSIFSGQPPSPTANGAGLMSGLQLDLGAVGDGAHNQTSIEASDPFPNNDTFQAADTMTALFHQIGGNAPPVRPSRSPGGPSRAWSRNGSCSDTAASPWDLGWKGSMGLPTGMRWPAVPSAGCLTSWRSP